MTLLHTVLNIFDAINYIKNKHNLLSFSIPSVLFCAAKVSSTRFSVSPLIFYHLIAQRGQIYNKSHGYFNHGYFYNPPNERHICLSSQQWFITRSRRCNKSHNIPSKYNYLSILLSNKLR